MRQIGKCFSAGFKLCGTLNLPRLSKTAYTNHENKLMLVNSEVSELSMQKAASELLVLHPTINKIVECGISVDGTWQRRGYSSMNGCVAALSVDTVNGGRYRAMITNFFIPKLSNHDVQELWFQQDGAICHTARATIHLLKDTFRDRLISRFGPVNWPPRSCDLTPLDYFLWGYLKLRWSTHRGIELTDMYLSYVEANGNGSEARRLYEQRFPTRRITSHLAFSSVHRRLQEFGLFVISNCNTGHL
ncbi:uncharacterized protein TNCV_4790321 [Trichonephila clavipes]|nr:uncharacterized protein TNCV_4790321 [Trichonephila clavipes]